MLDTTLPPEVLPQLQKQKKIQRSDNMAQAEQYHYVSRTGWDTGGPKLKNSGIWPTGFAIDLTNAWMQADTVEHIKCTYT
eukprot:6895761-Karenia_brevis.AAC.1